MAGRTKQDRRNWWNAKTWEEKEMYITQRQKRKTEQRRKRPPEPVKVNRKLPWMNEGVFVDDSNREQWKRTILAKNPWLKNF